MPKDVERRLLETNAGDGLLSILKTKLKARFNTIFFGFILGMENYKDTQTQQPPRPPPATASDPPASADWYLAVAGDAGLQSWWGLRKDVGTIL